MSLLILYKQKNNFKISREAGRSKIGDKNDSNPSNGYDTQGNCNYNVLKFSGNAVKFNNIVVTDYNDNTYSVADS